MEILIVEDEGRDRRLSGPRTRSAGYGVTVATDGIVGERLALSSSADLVILDRMLPGRDGIEVLAAIRRAKPALPVILLTAKAEVADRVEGLDLGATDYVTKPFAFDELRARIRARFRESGNGSETSLQAAGIRLDLLTREASRGEEIVRLPEREGVPARRQTALRRLAGLPCVDRSVGLVDRRLHVHRGR